jgi:predicted MFS family arabinose efflux permease
MSVLPESVAEGCPSMEPGVIASSARNRRTLAPMVAFAGTAIALAGLFLAAGAPSPLFVQYQQEWGFPAALLTVAFGAYAIALILALIIAGSLSDFVGRRPVLIGSLIVELASMLMFLFAPNIGWIIAARVVQGLATGAATSAFSASLLELAPDRARKVASIIGGAAPAGGLGLGALLSGIAVQFSTDASAIVFCALAVIMILGAVVAYFAAETVVRRPGALASLAPRLRIPAAARVEFAGTVPVLIGGWMFSALFIGLVPSIVSGIFDIHSGLVEGISVFIAPGVAAASGFVLGRYTPRTVLLVGGVAVAMGIAVVVAGIGAQVLPLIWFGGVVGGFGFGGTFSGTLRLLGPFADSRQRAELFAAVFLVSYLAFGVPAIILGQLVAPLGLLETVIGFGLVTFAAAIVGIVAQARLARRLVS